MINYSEILINKNKSILDAMKQLDKTAKKILFVIDENNKLVGSLTDGDIRRYILKSGSLDDNIEDVCNKSTFRGFVGYDKKKLISEAKTKDIKYIPIVSNENEIVEIIVLEDSALEAKITTFKDLYIPVVIMAGGFGTRLEPFTKVLPKPLIPIGDNTILEIIMEKFYQYGVSEFWLSVNYKSYIIKSYLNELNLPYKIHYIEEDKPLGTAGSLYLLKNKIESEYFILTNCDIILDFDYYSLLEFHKNNKSDMTIVASAKRYKIPYGVCEIEDGKLNKLVEKPELNLLVNTGMYVVNTSLLELIPENYFFHATDLIKKAKDLNKIISVYPISEESWIDIGQWDEYKKAIERFIT